MAGRRALFALCWPLLQGLSYLLTAILLPVSIELSALWGCAQLLVWMIVESTSVPTLDPYVPRAKRPPSYLEPFLAWLSATIDQAADKIVLSIRVRRRSTRTSYSEPTPPKPHIPHEAHRTEWERPFAKFNVVLWFHGYLFCKSNFSRWRVRPSFPSPTRVLALSAVTAGLAQANSVTVSSCNIRFGLFRYPH
jgi:hypothetical protein